MPAMGVEIVMTSLPSLRTLGDDTSPARPCCLLIVIYSRAQCRLGFKFNVAFGRHRHKQQLKSESQARPEVIRHQVEQVHTWQTTSIPNSTVSTRIDHCSTYRINTIHKESFNARKLLHILYPIIRSVRLQLYGTGACFSPAHALGIQV